MYVERPRYTAGRGRFLLALSLSTVTAVAVAAPLALKAASVRVVEPPASGIPAVGFSDRDPDGPSSLDPDIVIDRDGRGNIGPAPADGGAGISAEDDSTTLPVRRGTETSPDITEPAPTTTVEPTTMATIGESTTSTTDTSTSQPTSTTTEPDPSTTGPGGTTSSTTPTSSSTTTTTPSSSSSTDTTDGTLVGDTPTGDDADDGATGTTHP